VTAPQIATLAATDRSGFLAIEPQTLAPPSPIAAGMAPPRVTTGITRQAP
jgi:hypothetical protein